MKNNLKTQYANMPAVNQQYIKAELLPCLGASDKHIRSTVGTIISVLVQTGGVTGWPELLHALVKCLDSNDLNHMEGAMDALSKVCWEMGVGEYKQSRRNSIYLFLSSLNRTFFFYLNIYIFFLLEYTERLFYLMRFHLLFYYLFILIHAIHRFRHSYAFYYILCFYF